MSFIWGIIIVLLAMVWIVSVWDIVRRHPGPRSTAAWLLIIILLPFVGSLMYWVLRRPSDDEVRRRIDMDREMRHGT
jgi:hypothetical protein